MGGIVNIPVDELSIDPIANVRLVEWDYDDMLVSSIKSMNIINPLTVRPAKKSIRGEKYWIIAGSRRYHAACEAGLKYVPCIVVDVDDVEATAISIAENKHRRNVDEEKLAMKLKEMYDNILKREKKRGKAIEVLSRLTGFNPTTIRKYLSIAELEEPVRELVKPPEKRSKRTKEWLRRHGLKETTHLTVSKAYVLAKKAKKLKDKKLAEAVKAVASAKNVEQAEKAIASVIKGVQPVSNEIHISFKVSGDLATAVTRACEKYQYTPNKLAEEYLKRGLKEDGFYHCR